MRSTIAVLAVLLCRIALAEIPQVISYQGKVTDASGNPVADGPYTMQFRIYDALSGGTLLWDSGVRTVPVVGGVFSVLLGESPQPALGLDFNQDYWLAVTFAGVDQTPRQRLASVGYAYMASGLVPGTEVSGSVTSGTSAAIKGTNTAITSAAYGVIGETYASSGHGVRGVNYATTGYTCAVHGLAMSSAGRGVSGECNGTGGIGVVGWAGATTGPSNGVFGYSASPTGAGVVGQAAATTGGPHGVYGTSSASEGRGVTGVATATTGIVYGVCGNTYSPAGHGVYGRCYATGSSESGATGVTGISASSAGTGVYGYASAMTGFTYGVYGMDNSASGYGVYYQGGLAGSGGKSCVVKTSQGPTLMYCQESPENWFEDAGEGMLVDGKAHVELDALFLETVTIDGANPMKVFVEVEDELCAGVAVKRGQTGFDLVERMGGRTSGSFWYRVMAKRKGFESKRLDVCEAARTDSYLYPELREKEQAELEAERARRDEERTRMEEERAQRDEERTGMEEERAIGSRQ